MPQHQKAPDRSQEMRPTYEVVRFGFESPKLDFLKLRACLKTSFFVISTEANEVSEVEKSLYKSL
ncbi:hypothetical protein A3A46_01775 [Candidatus Roizmanbacteria bacterium RIFCSPLOWO2_01_FULL_37_13]|nr:MAG: hypothetical protein A3A46_01775 [Candidatus Roizmanbacteria bacterium RIFCSPLOWO2_01_FULL_37_13]